MKNQNKLKKTKQKLHHVNKWNIIFAIIIAIASFFLLRPLMTGYVVISEEINYVDNINQRFEQSQNYMWIPEYIGELVSVRIGGSIIGNGSVKVYIQKNNSKYLMLDSKEVREKKYAFITALVVGVNETIEETDKLEVSDSFVNYSLVEGNITNGKNNSLVEENLENKVINYSIENKTLPTSSPNVTEELKAGEPSVVPIEKLIRINLSYNTGTNYDVNNDGLETKDGIIDFTAEDTSFSWDVDYNKLCTKWEIYSVDKKESTVVCYGAMQCCNFIDLQPSSEKWDDPFYLYSGRYGATENNIISSQVIYIDYNINLDKPTAEIYSSDLDELPATFIEQITFNEVCSETCILYGFNQSSYNFVIEVEDGTVLQLDNISYRIKIKKILDLSAPNPVTNVQVSINGEGLLVNWENPSDLDFAGVRIIRKDGSYPEVNYTKAIKDDSAVDVSYLVSSTKEFILDKDVEYDKVYFYRVYAYDINLNYAPGQGAFKRFIDTSINHAPEFIKNISDITIFKNTKKILDLSEYFTDVDGDYLSFGYFNVNGIVITINNNITTIIPEEDFTGRRYTYLTANDSELTAVSNLILLHVMDYGLEYIENITQLKVEINKPVDWIKSVYVINREQETKTYDVELNIPEKSELISVYDVKEDRIINKSNIFFELNQTKTSLEDSMLSYDLFFEDVINANEEKEYIIRYQTPAPKVREELINDYRKRIIISSDISYTNILAYTNLVEESVQGAIRLYLITGNNKELVQDITYIDGNNNSLIDRIEWLVPHLSEQVYELEINSLELESVKFDNNTWMIKISTTGSANLTIQGLNTKIAEVITDDFETQDDIKIVSLKCNDSVLFDSNTINPNLYFVLEDDSLIQCPEIINNAFRINALLYKDYSCNSYGYLTVTTLTKQKHSLLFGFDGINRNISYLQNVKIPVTELYYKDSCPPCMYNATTEKPLFTSRTNAWHGYVDEGGPSFTTYAELDFDISSFSNKIAYAEICGFEYGAYNVKAFGLNYIQGIENIIKDHASTEVMPNSSMPHKNMTGNHNWECIPITNIVRDAILLNKSNLYIRWLGEDEKKQVLNSVFFRGPGAQLSECGGFNPSGANDCRPYLNIMY